MSEYGGGSDNNVYDDGVLSKIYFADLWKPYIAKKNWEMYKGVDAGFMNSKLFTVKLDNFSTSFIV